MMDFVEIHVKLVDGAGLRMIQLNGILKMQIVDVNFYVKISVQT